MKKKSVCKILTTMLVIAVTFCAACKNGAVSAHNGENQGEVYKVCAYEDDLLFDFEINMGEQQRISDLYSESIAGESMRLFYAMPTDNAFFCETMLVDKTGETTSLDLSTFYRKVLMAGPVIGTDDFVTFSEDNEESDYNFIETRKEDGNLIDEIRIQILQEDEGCCSISKDVDSYFHLLIRNYEDYNSLRYCILSENGECIYSETVNREDFGGFIPLNNGHFAVKVKNNNDGKVEVKTIDVKTLNSNVIFSYKEAEQANILAINVLDENTLIYMNEEGIYSCNSGMDSPIKLFDWKANGIVGPDNYCNGAIKVDENGTIEALIGQYQNQRYVVLEKFGEEQKEITIAVTAGERFYDEAIRDFNKTHPGIKVSKEVIEDRDSIKKRIIAGDVPVLIDSFLLDLNDSKEYLEPLDDYLKNSNLTEQMIEETIELGSINGKQYSVVLDWYIETLISDAKNAGWDYERFAFLVRESDSLEAISNNHLYRGKNFITTQILDRGPSDSYYFDEDGVTSRFGDATVMATLEKIASLKDGEMEPSYVEGVKNGTVLCEAITIDSPEVLAAFWEIYPEEMKMVGFPRKHGAKHILEAGHALSISKKSSQEDKEMAMEFVEYLMSRKVQRKMLSEKYNADMMFPSREDMIRERIDRRSSVSNSDKYFIPIGFTFKKEITTEQILQDLHELLKNSEVDRGENAAYKEIMYEEFGGYFSGRCNIDALSDHLSNRLKTYLMERE